jgi:hypothetical protein
MITPTSLVKRLKNTLHRIGHIDQALNDVKVNQGRILATLNEARKSKCLKDFEFKVFSQWGEDGIIQHLTKSILITNRTFIEFGVEDFFESNCRYLMMKDNWQGFVIDGSKDNITRLRAAPFYWQHRLEAIDAFVTQDNIDDLLAQSGFEADLGILSIDLDGNDYYVLKALKGFRPRILICEYNAVFGPTRAISVPYRADFQRTKAHSSNLYWGASLAAMTLLARQRGYALVGTNSAGNNAFFLRNDLVDERFQVLSPEQAYAPSSYRESRDSRGQLSFEPPARRVQLLSGMPVINVETGANELL